MTKFSDLGLSTETLKAVEKQKFITPTEIQEKAIPIIISRKDLVASSQTGTGKTAAFALSVITKLQKETKQNHIKCLILEPVRELAIQVSQIFKQLSQFTNLNVVLIHGGVGFKKQINDLKNNPDIVISTPGRLIDLLDKKYITLNKLNTLILDEVDRLLDMGFIQDINKIIALTPKNRQTLLFSATISKVILNLTNNILKNPEKIEISSHIKIVDNIKHSFYPVAQEQKKLLLIEIIKTMDYQSIIIFSRTKRLADKLSRSLKKECKTDVKTLHSDIPQNKRTRIIDDFRKKKFNIIVATDVASRGLDINSISHVINYNLPDTPDDYIHRIGRTGRAEKKGTAITLLSYEEFAQSILIEKTLGKEISHDVLKDFDYTFTQLLHGDSDLETLRKKYLAKLNSPKSDKSSSKKIIKKNRFKQNYKKNFKTKNLKSKNTQAKKFSPSKKKYFKKKTTTNDKK